MSQVTRQYITRCESFHYYLNWNIYQKHSFFVHCPTIFFYRNQQASNISTKHQTSTNSNQFSLCATWGLICVSDTRNFHNIFDHNWKYVGFFRSSFYLIYTIYILITVFSIANLFLRDVNSNISLFFCFVLFCFNSIFFGKILDKRYLKFRLVSKENGPGSLLFLDRA